ncbi:MAG: RHS repeat-associated core domain-containing protein, partial [Pseudomonadales bacterium]
GRREKTWVSDITAASTTALLASEDELSPRGFTDHEMLNRTGFVHMNGRVYDPRIGRFVSADPIVQFPGFSQSYNRYSYTLNSPLSLVDPSGFMSSDVVEGSDGSLFGQLSAPNIPGSLGGESSQDSERIVLLNMLAVENGLPWLNDWVDNGGRLPAPSVATPPVAPARPPGDGCSSPAGCGAVAVASGKVSCPAPLECAATTGGTNSDLFDGFGPKALQVSIELGGEGFFGVFGASKSTGFLMDPFRFEVCRVQTTCGRVGLGLFLGVGAEGSISVSAPLTTGTVNSTGVFGRIGIGDVSVGGSLNVSDGGVGGVKGLVGVGGGVVLGVQQCESRVTCE